MAREHWLPECEHPNHVPGWHFQKGPGRALVKHHGMARYWSPRWATNQYRVESSDGSWVYWSEPVRDFDSDAFADLAYLKELGYCIRLVSCATRHVGDGPSICIYEQQPKATTLICIR